MCDITCDNLCRNCFSQEHCQYCKKNYIVSTEEYRALRPASHAWVYGYLVRNKCDNSIHGILNKANHYAELAWIEADTWELVNPAKECETENPKMKFIVFYECSHEKKKSSELTVEDVGEYLHQIFLQGAYGVKVVCLD